MKILVDTDVRVGARDVPRKVVDAIRRQLRDHDLPALLAHDGSQRDLLDLLRSDDDEHSMPQGLLPRLTETCRRHGVEFAVVDKRAMVACSALRRGSGELSATQTAAVQRLLMHDAGVLVAAAAEDSVAVVSEMIARRKQRTLLLAADAAACTRWLVALGAALDARAPAIAALADASSATRVAVATYAEALDAGSTAFDKRGFIVFDGAASIDPIPLMRAVRATGARYMLGVAGHTVRPDGLQQPLFLALGGVAHQMPAPTSRSGVQLAYRPQPTAFDFAYGGRADYQAMVAALAGDTARNQLIVSDIAREAAAGNLCLVISERRDHLTTLAEALPAELRVARLTSDLKPRQRGEVAARVGRGEVDVVLATSQLALDGLKSAAFARLFIAFPFSHARRLERLVALLLAPAPGKTHALVYDYDDATIAPLHRGFGARARVLERLRRDAHRRYMDWAQLSLGV